MYTIPPAPFPYGTSGPGGPDDPNGPFGPNGPGGPGNPGLSNSGNPGSGTPGNGNGNGNGNRNGANGSGSGNGSGNGNGSGDGNGNGNGNGIGGGKSGPGTAFGTTPAALRSLANQIRAAADAVSANPYAKPIKDLADLLGAAGKEVRPIPGAGELADRLYKESNAANWDAVPPSDVYELADRIDGLANALAEKIAADEAARKAANAGAAGGTGKDGASTGAPAGSAGSKENFKGAAAAGVRITDGLWALLGVVLFVV